MVAIKSLRALHHSIVLATRQGRHENKLWVNISLIRTPLPENKDIPNCHGILRSMIAQKIPDTVEWMLFFGGFYRVKSTKEVIIFRVYLWNTYIVQAFAFVENIVLSSWFLALFRDPGRVITLFVEIQNVLHWTLTYNQLISSSRLTPPPPPPLQENREIKRKVFWEAEPMEYGRICQR